MLDDRDILIKVLCFGYRRMVASAPLLAFAIEHSKGPLKAYYLKHLAEETGHDEMMRDDLARLGVTDIPHSLLAAKICGMQYYLIAHEHPAMLLGYMHACESRTHPAEYVDQLCAIHGELTAMRHHAAHDPGHAADLEHQISLLDPELRARVLWNGDQVRKMVEAEFVSEAFPIEEALC